jgi:decaprenylphospho-beta-D-erythro-pentofuranosid-2-ulose 2-reductase
MRILLLGGTSEIGLAVLSAMDLPKEAEVVLAGRDPRRMEAAERTLSCQVETLTYDATDVASHQAFADSVCAAGVPDVIIAAAGILIPQPRAEAEVPLAAAMIQTNFTGLVTTLLAFGAHMKARGSGTIVVLSSVAAVRPRRFNSVYGAAKAGLDAFARGYADSLHGSGVRLLLVRPGFVIGRMTAGMPAAPLSSTPAQVGTAVAGALEGKTTQIWVPGSLAVLATALKCVPRPLWRKMRR